MSDTTLQTIDLALGQWVNTAVQSLFPETPADRVRVVPTNDARFGDYQCNVAMTLAKQAGKPPREIAVDIQAALPEHPAVAEITIAGPGFLNFTLHDNWLGEQLSAQSVDFSPAIVPVGAGQSLVIDYSSPNVAKPMHIGHIRSTVIGSTLDRLYRKVGYRVVSDNHLGDWGTQFGLLIIGYRTLLDEQALEADPIGELERVYVASAAQAKEDPAWREQAKSELVKLQQGDPENRALWEQFIEWSMAEFDRVYGRLGVSFDLTRGESWYNDRLPGVLEQLDAAGLLVESEGAQIVDLEEVGLNVCIVKKTDGGFNYATTDIATVLSRVEEFDPARIVYVTDERQQLHFRQFFHVCNALGVKTELKHVWFGLMRLPEGTFSTREGNVIKLERMLDEAEERALAIVCEKSPDMPEDQQREVARAVGIGAIKYADLSQNPQSLVTFTWDKALALDGNSGPYLQYVYARIRSVLDKFADAFPEVDLDRHPVSVLEPQERAVAVQLLRYPEAVAGAVAHDRPSIIADYLYELAQAYSSFYQNLPFLKADEGVRESRLNLCRVVAATMRDGLELLGIETPERI